MARRFITLFLIVIMVVDLCGIETKASGNTDTGEIDFDLCVPFCTAGRGFYSDKCRKLKYKWGYYFWR